jgi:hypothetical protein
MRCIEREYIEEYLAEARANRKEFHKPTISELKKKAYPLPDGVYYDELKNSEFSWNELLELLMLDLSNIDEEIFIQYVYDDWGPNGRGYITLGTENIGFRSPFRKEWP